MTFLLSKFSPKAATAFCAAWLLRSIFAGVLAAVYSGPAAAQPSFNEEFNSNSPPNEEFHSSGGNFWESHEKQYPDCAGVIEAHYQLTLEIRETAEAGRYLTGKAKTENGKKVNELAHERSKLMRQIQECIRAVTIKNRRPPGKPTVRPTPLRGSVSDGEPKPTPSLVPQNPMLGVTPKPAPPRRATPFPLEQPTWVEQPEGSPTPMLTPLLNVSPHPSPSSLPNSSPTPQWTPLQGNVEKGPHDDENESSESPSPTPADSKQPLCIFHYFYINGMNTPYEIPGAPRGDYKEEYGLVFHNLVQFMANEFDALKERHYMMKPTPNQSGLDPKNGSDPLVVAGCLALAPETDRWRCLLPSVSNCIRRGNDKLTVDGKEYPGELPTGDMIEVLRQGLSFAGQGIEFSSRTPLVEDIVGQMKQTAGSAGDPVLEKHFFIVVAHSQGNFFAEAVPWNLQRNDPDLLPLTGIFGIGCPTNYQRVASLLQPGQIQTNTRADDLILTLNRPLNNVFKGMNDAANIVGELLQNLKISTVPALPNLPALFPDRRQLLDTFGGPSPSVSFPAAVVKCIKLSHGDSGPAQAPSNDAQVPILDAHLMTNYLNDPPPHGGTPVLEAMRYNLLKLTDQFCPHDHWPKLQPSASPGSDSGGGDSGGSEDAPQPTPTPGPYRLRIWLNAFIPNDLRALNLWGQTHKNIDGRTYVLGPDNNGYATDQRGFSLDHAASARFHGEALLEVDAQGNTRLLEKESHCTPTEAINLLTGETICKKPAERCDQMLMTPLNSPGDIFVMDLKANPTNPCVEVLGMNPSPPISVLATFQVMTKSRQVLLAGDLSQFPAFEAYVQVESLDGSPSVARPIFRKLPVTEKSPIDLYKGLTEEVYDAKAHY